MGIVGHFPMNKPLITMTHVCRSWRNVLLSTPSLWTQIDFSMSTKSQQAEGFLRRSGNQPLDIYQYLEDDGSNRTLPFHHTPQPISPPGAVDYSCLPYLRTLVEKLFGIGARAEAPRDRK
jgi:hypothetical protein